MEALVAARIRSGTTRLVLGGDAMLSRHVGRLARMQGDPAWSWRDIASVFQSADIGFVNLESPFSDRGDVVDAGMVFKAEPEMIEGLKLAGIDVVLPPTTMRAIRAAGASSLRSIGWSGMGSRRRGAGVRERKRTPER